MADLQKIMGLSVQNLAKEQHTALKQHVIDTLKAVLKTIQDEEYEDVGNYLGYSGSGDGYGQENHYIDFSYDPKEAWDISQVVYELTELKQAFTK